MAAERTKLVLNLSPEAEEHLATIARQAYGRSDTEAYQNLFLLVSLMDTLAKSEEPRVLEAGSLEISNRAYRERIGSTDILPAPVTLPLATAADENESLVRKIWNSVELKPGFAGLRIDLKKFLKLPKGW